MNHEQQPPQEPDQPEDRNAPQWDPDEQVGDIYEIELGSRGIEHIEKLAGDATGDDAEHEQPETTPRVWVGSWLDYNNGVLYGEWIPANREDTEIWEDIQTMLAQSPTAAETGETAEDWGIFDYENFGNWRVGEQESVAWVAKVARGISEHGLAFAAWADVMEEEGALDGFTDAYLGHYATAEAYAEQLVDDLGYEQLIDNAVPAHLRPYVRLDVAGLANDMQIGGDIHALPADDGGVWIFDGR